MAPLKKVRCIQGKFSYSELKEADRALYWLFQIAYDLKLISYKAFHHATTAETNLLTPIEDI